MIAGASMVVAGLFAQDPLNTRKEQLTTHGNLHALASMVGIPGFPIAAVLISLSLARTQAWSSARRSLLWTAHLTWISLLLMFAALFIMLGRTKGKFGPQVLIGWPNRLVVVIDSVWLMVVAWRTFHLSRQGA